MDAEVRRERITTVALALLVFMISFGVLFKTVAPTVSFWDCGEFIACSYSLGIPHPPGTPFFIILGRVFILLLFFFKEIAYRINFLTILSSAMTVMFSFLVIVKLVRYWLVPIDSWIKLTILYSGGVVGSLMVSFSDTYWFNSVEAEVYGVSMFILMLCTWLTLCWFEQKEVIQKERLLILIIYLSFIGIGVHMYTMLALPPVFLFLLALDKEKIKDFRLWIVGGILYAVITFTTGFLSASCLLLIALLYLVGIKFNPRPQLWLTLSILLGAALIIFFFFKFIPARDLVEAPSFLLCGFATILFFSGFIREARDYPRWRFLFWIVVVAVLGYSVNLFIPLRSMLEPMIDENDPQTWESFKGFLERKQYGAESMMQSMFQRHGEWVHQFGEHQHMGFGGYFMGQYSRRELFIIPLALGLFGMFWQWSRHRISAYYFMILFLITSLGLILYMNFSDGTKGIRLEVRDRDYFYAPGFMFFGMWIGIGISAFLQWCYESLEERERIKKWAVGALAVMLLLTPLEPLAKHYYNHNRKGDYFAYDYAYNILQSCEENGIVFTNGDNDTFPLWFLQEVEGIRKDVRVVNLSLLNTNWYIHQLKHLDPAVAINFTDEQIEQIAPTRLSNAAKATVQGIDFHFAANQIIRVQDLMIINIIDANAWRKPIYFAVTVPRSNYLGLDDRLVMEGMVYRLYPEKASKNFDIERTIYKIDHVYQFRGVNDPKIHKDENTRTLLSNYGAIYLGLAMELKSLNRQQEAINYLTKCSDLLPDDWRNYLLLSEIYGNLNQNAAAAENLKKAIALEPNRDEFKINLAITYQRGNSYREAATVYRSLYEQYKGQDKNNSNFSRSFLGLRECYEALNEFDSALELTREVLSYYPTDRNLINFIQQTEEKKSKFLKVQGDTAKKG